MTANEAAAPGCCIVVLTNMQQSERDAGQKADAGAIKLQALKKLCCKCKSNKAALELDGAKPLLK